MGRPLNKKQKTEAFSKIVAAVKNCSTVAAACAWAGVSEASFYEWLKNDESLKIEYQAAVAQSEIALVAEIKKDKSWQSKAWLLERRFPLRWGIATQRPWESLPELGDPDFNPAKKS